MPMANHASGLGRTRARHEHRVIHLINPLWDAHGGGDWDAIEMYRALQGLCRVRLWSSVTPADPINVAWPPSGMVRLLAGLFEFAPTRSGLVYPL